MIAIAYDASFFLANDGSVYSQPGEHESLKSTRSHFLFLNVMRVSDFDESVASAQFPLRLTTF